MISKIKNALSRKIPKEQDG